MVALTKYKLGELVNLSTISITPINGIEYKLYSLPSFDDGQIPEIQLGHNIQSNKYIVPTKCILFNKLNVRFKRVWRIENLEQNKICSTEFLPLIVNSNLVDFNYCYYLLISDSITNYLCGQNTNTSGSHKRIDPNNLFDIEVSLPCIEYQRKIGKTLSDIDSKIKLNHSLNHNLEAMAKQLYDYWFVQFDFPNAEGKPYKSSGGKMVWNDKLKLNIPESWSAKDLQNMTKIKNGATPSTADENNYGGDVVWITPKDLSDQQSKFVYQGARNITETGYESCSTTMLPIGTVLLSSRAPIGLVSIARTELCTNQGFKSLVPINGTDTNYLYYYIKSHITQIEQLGSGTTFKEVSRGELTKFPILYCPEQNIMNDWTKRITSITEQQFVLTKEIAALTKQRDELLPLLMNGQATVNYDL